MASKKVSVSSTSLSMTLPISCQICLGKVREPVVCPNQHVFCSTCMDTWLRSHSFCPTCRTSITTEQPCKKILGSIDLPVNSDAVTRAELRRTRLDLIRREYEDELKSLQNTVERLKSENKQLHEKMIERERTMASMDFTTRSRGADDGASKLDIDMLVKLTTRLQETSHTYENLRGDMDKIKQDNRKLQEENKNLMRENARLKEDPKFSKSPQRYSHYTMAGLQTKVGQYEREVQQLKRALLRSDSYIEDLSSKLEVATGQPIPKNTRPRNSPAASSSSCTITSLSSEKDGTESTTAGINSDVQDAEKLDLPEAANLPTDNKLKKLTTAISVSENLTSRGHSPLLATANSERLSLETSATMGDERESGLSSRRSSEVSLYGQDLDIPPGPLTSSLNILEPVEGEATDRPPSRGELLLLGDRSSRRSEKPSLEENLDMFTASRQLIMLSERRSRHRDGIDSMKMRDLNECSPSSSDGGKRKLLDTKSIDFDALVSVAGEDSASNSTSRESPPNFSRDELDDRASPEIRTFSLAKIKSEIGIGGQEDETAPKKPRLESGEFDNDSNNIDRRDS